MGRRAPLGYGSGQAGVRMSKTHSIQKVELSKNSRSIFRKAKDFYIKCIRILFKSTRRYVLPCFLKHVAL